MGDVVRVGAIKPAMRLLQSTATFAAFIAGNGCAKTYTMAQLAAMTMSRHRGLTVLIGNPTYKGLALATFSKIKVALAAMGLREGSDFFANKSAMTWWWPRFESLWIGLSGEMETTKLEGYEGGLLLIDEIAGWEQEKVAALVARIRQPGMPNYVRYFGYPPVHGGWFWQMFAGPDHAPDAELIQAPTHANLRSQGGFLDDGYLRALETMYRPGTPMHKRKVLGEFAPTEGLVYQSFDYARHVVDSITEPVVGYVYGLDFGYKPAPLVLLRAAIGASGNLYIDAEHYSAELRYEEHWARMREMYTGAPCFCDHDGQGRAELEHFGLNVRPAMKAVTLGIDAVESRLAEGRLFFVGGACTNTLREIGLYCYPPERAGADPREPQPLKKNDHAMDALRYLVCGVDLAPSHVAVRKRADDVRHVLHRTGRR